MKEEKQTTNFYYVQILEAGSLPQIVHHTYDKKTDQYYYKFLDRKKAKKFMESERINNPKAKFRVVKLTETFTTTDFS